jgi:hypothetical protein
MTVAGRTGWFAAVVVCAGLASMSPACSSSNVNTDSTDAAANADPTDAAGNAGSTDAAETVGSVDAAGNVDPTDAAENAGSADAAENAGSADAAGNAGSADAAGNAGSADAGGNAGSADAGGNAGSADAGGNAGSADAGGNAGSADAGNEIPVDENGFGRKYKFVENEIAGWKQDASPSAYSVWTPKNLTEKIDGAADAYITRGFRWAMYQDLVGPDPSICSVTAMDFGTDAKATFMFTYQREHTGAAVTIPSYDPAVAIGAEALTGITVFAHFKASYFEVQLDGYSDPTSAAQAAQQFLDVLKGKTR